MKYDGVQMNATLQQKRLLMETLSSWKRWRDAGFPKDAHPFHDNYHNGITDRGDGRYAFNIQTYDSPAGDVWWYGEFKTLNGDTDVELLSSATWEN